MSKILSLYGKTISLIVIVFVVSLTVISLAFISISASEERDQVRELERTILVANSLVRDFIITRDPEFAKDTELILQQADQIVQEGVRAENFQKLHNEVLLYLHSIDNLIEAYQEMGFYEEDGIEGVIRNQLVEVESKLTEAGFHEARVALLSARRHEKNFMLRGHEEYIVGVHESIDELMRVLGASSLSAADMSHLFGVLAEYQHNFDRLVSATERVGWIKGELHYFRENIGGTLQTVIAAERRRALTYLWAALGLILCAFVFGIVYSMHVAKSVLTPLSKMKAMVQRVADGEDVDMEKLKDSEELSELLTSVKEVAEQVRLRKEAEAGLHKSKEAIQQYASELESRTEQLDAAVSSLENSRNLAENASRKKAEFLANMSHEIRTPLNGIIGMTSLLSTDELKADQKEVVDVIRTSGESLLDIVNHILDFSKIEAGGVDLEEASFSIRNCVEDALGMVSRQASEKALDLSYDLDTQLPSHVVGDESRLRQVLINLLGNAVKFTKEGEIQVRVRAIDGSGDSVRLGFDIEDTGIGIAASLQQALFDPFQQADASTARKFGGTGLGLSISQGLVALMGGNMQVESQPGSGSVFSFEIDVRRSNEASDPAVRPEWVGKRTLILNRVEMIGRALKSTMSEFGLESDIVDNEGDATKYLAERSYVAVFINECTAGFDGVAGMAIAGIIHDAAPETPIVVLRHIHHQMESSVTKCLLKPVRQSAIKDILLNLTDDHPSPIQETEAKSFAQDRSPKTMIRRNVLLVEDNIVNQKVGVRMLEKIGCNVDVVDGGADAISAVQTGKYAAVFMDVQMPGIDGLEATRRIRSLGDIVQPIIIALTANATTEDRTRCLESGMDDYLAKPVNAKTLEMMLDQYVLEVRSDNRESSRA